MVPGTILAHYRIVSRLGAGGMGEVWLAEDTILGRQAALKLLPPEVARDGESMRRFAQEAKAAAALNHPNIAHIYESGESGGLPFLAMEYVEGQTLAASIHGKPVPADHILDWSVQIADALEEAHGKGIAHRDIKPANIMVTPRGLVKVLDFGLAKLIPSTRVPAVGAAITNTGEAATESDRSGSQAVGTLHYMSPEQALARDLDHRTDIFSLGAVLYEMATGRRAFPGNTPAAIFDAILNKTPTPADKVNPEIPAALGRIIDKALEKDRDLRYQTVSDLRADLKRVKRDTLSGQHEAARPAVRPWLRWAAGAALLVIAAGIGWFARHRASRGGLPAGMKTVPLTAYQGSETQPSFSPDGTQVVFAWNQGGRYQDDWNLFVKLVDAGTPLQLTKDPAIDYGAAWSPDGRHIAFLRHDDRSGAFLLIPALGGMERKLSDASPDRMGVESPFAAWMPDGRMLVLVDKADPSDPLSLWLFDLESGKRRQLTFPPSRTRGDSSPAVSPDGKRIAFVRTGSIGIQDIHVIPASGGEPSRVTFDNRRIYGMVWNPADNRILFSSARSPNSRLWRVPPEGGEPERLAGVADSAVFLAITRNGDRLAFTKSNFDTNVWRFPLPAGKTGRSDRAEGELFISSTRVEQGPRYSPDGKRIAFASSRGGSLEVWICDAECRAPTQVTNFNGPPTGSPMWSPDSRFLAFDSRPGGNPDVYIVAADGGLPRRLTSEPSEEVVPSWSRDGRWIYFASNRTGRFELWKCPAAGGPAQQVTHGGGFHGRESFDGEWVYYARSSSGPGLWRVPAAGGQEEPVIEKFRPGYWGYWSLTGHGIYYLERDESAEPAAQYSLRFFDFASRASRFVMPLPKRPFNSGLSVSPDLKYLLYTQVDTSDTDIMLVDHFR